MPVLLESAPLARPALSQRTRTAATRLDIGLLNNLPDAALREGERQFISLLEDAAGTFDIRLRLYSLPQINRGSAAQKRIGTLYADVTGLFDAHFDGMIVTGCEPTTARLNDEPLWQGLASIIDWAEHHTVSTIWSCLAAHAAVLHLDGIERSPLRDKRSGVFPVSSTGEHELLAGSTASRRVPHSRLNDLPASDLNAHGYGVLTQSAEAGVDMFVKQWGSLFVYLQGHPEYDGSALAREYRRDIARFLSGTSNDFPAVPEFYFPAATETALRDFEHRARADRRQQALAALPFDPVALGGAAVAWRSDAVQLVRNWLGYIAANRV